MAGSDIDGDGLLLVTGASGFVGSAIAIAARKAGYRVRVLVRRSSPRTNIQFEDEVVIGDICDRASLAQALRGVRYLAHAAADYRLWSPSPAAIIRTNLEGTRCLMEEALRAGVERIVYTSSVATLEVQGDLPARETRPLPEDKAIGTYKKSKVLAERLVEEMVRQHRLPAVIVNPSAPIGPRDVKPTPTGRIIVESACGRIPGIRGYRPQSRPRRRRSERASCGLAAWRNRRTVYSRRGERASRQHARGRRQHCWSSPTHPAISDCRAISGCVWRRTLGAPDRKGAIRDAGRAAHGAPSHVLQRRESEARTWIYLAALSRGHCGCDCVVQSTWISALKCMVAVCALRPA